MWYCWFSLESDENVQGVRASRMLLPEEIENRKVQEMAWDVRRLKVQEMPSHCPGVLTCKESLKQPNPHSFIAAFSFFAAASLAAAFAPIVNQEDILPLLDLPRALALTPAPSCNIWRLSCWCTCPTPTSPICLALPLLLVLGAAGADLALEAVAALALGAAALVLAFGAAGLVGAFGAAARDAAHARTKPKRFKSYIHPSRSYC
ncbi:hypothetical protein BRADI_1g09020v3 [Brachypodium distachyon]|uniref:Uncharacterized protein n=1 Tax=Brachypodium distachyon TaxID=15368 RepID=I1GNF5_BRADI|nr:hypothetical protein BRADI_1g09020v3 [Brachypodium distachyon]